MKLQEIEKVKKELEEFVYSFRSIIGRSERMRWCKEYMCGLLMDGERKSIEPMARRIPGGNVQNMQQFVNQSPWDHEAVQNELLEKMKKFMVSGKGALILDDTSFPKKGSHSVGVARQYCGAVGKIANCQVMVSWQYWGDGGHWPVNAELYLPQEWTGDRSRMKRAGVPERRFRHMKKWELALELLKKIRDKLPHRALIFDAGYGELRPFLRELDALDELFIGRIPETHAFWPIDVPLQKEGKNTGRPRVYPSVADKTIRPLSARQWAERLADAKGWETFRLPTKRNKKVKAIGIRVLEVNQQAYWRPGIERWLIIEKDEHEQRYYVSSFPKNTSLKEMVHCNHVRWSIDQGYQQLKEELGMDHFEGRSWKGFHHHVTLSYMAYDFLHYVRSKSGKKKTQTTYAPANKTVDSRDCDSYAMPGLSPVDYKGSCHIFPTRIT